jgi:hypothetical protein
MKTGFRMVGRVVLQQSTQQETLDMKPAITVLFLLAALVNSASAQRSASMTIRATVVANTTFTADVSETNAVVTGTGHTPYGMTLTAHSQTGETTMKTETLPPNVTLSSDQTVLAQGVSTPSQRRRIEIEHAQLSAKPSGYTVTVQYY